MRRDETVDANWTSLALAMPWPRPRNPNAVVIWPRPEPESPLQAIDRVLDEMAEAWLDRHPSLSDRDFRAPWDSTVLDRAWYVLAERLADGRRHRVDDLEWAAYGDTSTPHRVTRRLVDELVDAGVLANDRRVRGCRTVRLAVDLDW